MPMLFARDKSRALFEAIQKNKPDLVKQLLGKGVDVNTDEQCYSLDEGPFAKPHKVARNFLTGNLI
jgi:hypothetical protein